MSEYIIEWSGIGARIVELIGSVPACLIPKRLREERLREEIVRCRDCEHYEPESTWYETREVGYPPELCMEPPVCKGWAFMDSYGNKIVHDTKPDGYCYRAKRKEGGA